MKLARKPKPSRTLRSCLVLLFALAASCGSVRNWSELQTEPMPIGVAWNGFVEIATARNIWLPDHSAVDRGNGTWQSRWRERQGDGNFPIRTRLRAEFLLDDGSSEEGWLLRYVVEQEKCKDLRRHAAPREEDWSPDGQDSVAEANLAQRLVRRLAPKSVQIPDRSERQPGMWDPPGR